MYHAASPPRLVMIELRAPSTAHRLSHLPPRGQCAHAGAADRDPKKANWLLGGVPTQHVCLVAILCLRGGRHRQEAGECVRPAVDVIGRCNLPMSVSAKLDRGETVCSHAMLLFYQTASARWCAPIPCRAGA